MNSVPVETVIGPDPGFCHRCGGVEDLRNFRVQGGRALSRTVLLCGGCTSLVWAAATTMLANQPVALVPSPTTAPPQPLTLPADAGPESLFRPGDVVVMVQRADPRIKFSSESFPTWPGTVQRAWNHGQRVGADRTSMPMWVYHVHFEDAPGDFSHDYMPVTAYQLEFAPGWERPTNP
ncbi:hypothetical protein [Nocardia sp. NPDC051750]|uniref:hypothetical protein n=1 Tax=Nocardia sp. NPDC051750 TaxID=3364325 RepID=UPI0037B1855F